MNADGRARQEPAGAARVLALLLTIGEPFAFALAAAGSFNAVSVRGLPVVGVLVARLLTTALSVAAGRALLDGRALAPALTRVALVASAAVHIVVYLTPYFPSNRLPGQTPLYVTATILYYGSWLAYVLRSKWIAALTS
jgi:hypothetical protein